MKTKEHLNQEYAHGPINLYDIYLEGYQDCKKDNEDNFRREAAKDILCALIANGQIPVNADSVTPCIGLADALIRQLKEEKK
jgi:hypothetical protein